MIYSCTHDNAIKQKDKPVASKEQKVKRQPDTRWGKLIWDRSNYLRLNDQRNVAFHNSQIEKVMPRNCLRCGDNWHHPNNSCPAMNQQCKRCFKMNHFARACVDLAERLQQIRNKKIFAILPLNARLIKWEWLWITTKYFCCPPHLQHEARQHQCKHRWFLI